MSRWQRILVWFGLARAPHVPGEVWMVEPEGWVEMLWRLQNQRLDGLAAANRAIHWLGDELMPRICSRRLGWTPWAWHGDWTWIDNHQTEGETT